MRAPRDVGRHPAPSLDWNMISLAVYDQRRRLDRGNDVANVDLLVDEAQPAHSARRNALSVEIDERPNLVLVVHDRPHRGKGFLTRAQDLEVLLGVAVVLFFGHAPRVVRRPQVPGETSDQDERVGPLRVGGGEDDSQWHTWDHPIRAARDEPTASITARMSSIRASRVGAPTTRSDIPVPRLSKMMRRENEASSW